jgi:cell pole-organizing protein PopZ
MAMSQSAKAQEPSMEEILASIRRIIADDDAPKAAPKPEPVVSPPRPAAATLRAVATPPAAPPSPRPAPQSNADQDEINAMLSALDSREADEPSAASSEDEPELDNAMAAPLPDPRSPSVDPQTKANDEPSAATGQAQRAHEQAFGRGMLSTEASAAVDSAFNTLAHTVLLQNARTLEDMVREMLRPLLKSWLDDNLPSMVERIVRAEIERVSRGRV